MENPRVNVWVFCSLLTVISFFTACKPKLVCPAYQSMFILDPVVRDQTFSMFGEDSMPKAEIQVNKNEYLVLKPVDKKKKEKALRTVPMVTIMPPPAIKDSLANPAVVNPNDIAEPNTTPPAADTTSDDF